MPNLAVVLRSEIFRLARRSIRPFIVPLKKDVAALKRGKREVRQRLAVMVPGNRATTIREDRAAGRRTRPRRRVRHWTNLGSYEQ